MTTSSLIGTSGSSFIGPDGERMTRRGVCLGGWLNMENFRGLDDSELDALADSFGFESCAVREPLLAELRRGLSGGLP